MFDYRGRNVNHLFGRLAMDIQQFGVLRNSRAGEVIEFPEPVTITYTHPMERVLFNRYRMANHVFHLFESLWMICGRNDVQFLSHFNSQMAQYSDDGSTFNGAYGYRAATHFSVQQFVEVIAKLKHNPDDRRAVVQLWDAAVDLRSWSKDHPCNTVWYFKIRDGALDMTACLRSNDLLYGAMGANIVHCTVIQEWLAACIGVRVGKYNTLSDSMHVYVNLPLWQEMREKVSYYVDDPYTYETPEPHVKPYSIMQGCDPSDWMRDCARFMDDPFSEAPYITPFFNDVVQPMAVCWKTHKETRSGMSVVNDIKAVDWRNGVRQWMTVKEG